MRKLHKFALTGVAALMVCAAFVSSASAQIAYDQGTGANLAVGTMVHGVTDTTNLHATFWGTDIHCTSTPDALGNTQYASYVGGTVTANNPMATGDIVDVAFHHCINVANGIECTVTPNGLPWAPATAGGLTATSLTTLVVAMGSTGSVTVSGCNLPFACTFKGASTISGLTNAIQGTWNNTNGTVTFNTSNNLTSACGPATWAGTYTLMTGTLTRNAAGTYTGPTTGNLVGVH